MAGLKLLYDCKYNNWLSPYSGYTEFIERKTAMFLEKPVNAMEEQTRTIKCQTL